MGFLDKLLGIEPKNEKEKKEDKVQMVRCGRCGGEGKLPATSGEMFRPVCNTCQGSGWVPARR